MTRKLLANLLCILVIVGLHSNARADLIVVPEAFVSVAGNDFERSSLGIFNNRYQQVYGASLLSGLHVGDLVTGLTFRLDGESSSLSAQTVANYELRLSRSVNPAGSLSFTFADNRGPDEVIVRTGPLIINPGDFSGGSTLNPFGAIVHFTVPYVYKGGPLLLEAAHTQFPLGGQSVDGQSFSPGLDAQSIFGSGPTATTADLQNAPNSALIVEFQTAVPEPSSLSLLGIGVGGLVGCARQRCRQVD